MNRTKIEWCDFTWNPVSGCLHNCPYCYAKRIAERFKGKAFPKGFEPTFYPERLQEPMKVKKPSRIFVGSMADLFGEWTWGFPGSAAGFATSDHVINCILNAVRRCSQHTFLFLTKNPKAYEGYSFPSNCLIGTTITNPDALGQLIRATELHKTGLGAFISFEPLLSGLPKNHSFIFPGLKWVIIGAQTGPGAKPVDPKWVNRIVNKCRTNSVPVFIKDNVKCPIKIQEYPVTP